MKFILSIFIIGFTSMTFAKNLEDVTLLDIKYVNQGFELKLQTKEQAPKNAYFIVDIIREDEKAFEKLALVLKKQKKKESFKLDLDILSFSAFPSGAYYRSTSVKFSGSIQDESLIIP